MSNDPFRKCLEDIIYASDGCHGHRGCNHSLEPWQRARRLLFPKLYVDEPQSADDWTVSDRDQRLGLTHLDQPRG